MRGDIGPPQPREMISHVFSQRITKCHVLLDFSFFLIELPGHIKPHFFFSFQTTRQIFPWGGVRIFDSRLSSYSRHMNGKETFGNFFSFQS